MKKLITIILILALALPALALADYSSALDMTMEDFINKYNAVQAPLGSPYTALDKPNAWTKWEGYFVAWFTADKNEEAKILLYSKDPNCKQMLTAGLDEIHIYAGKTDFVPMISVANRCASVFAADIFGSSIAPFKVTSVISYYYENNAKEKRLIAYNTLDAEEKVSIAFQADGDLYLFKILNREAIQ
ncbi:MAG: hypothetical protein J6S83_02695 [Lachnospiraceae bacterium]|nr:hypothetical protein [Lachnospiraceae bacterium]